ncbi:D-apiose isomerase-like [Saccostrea echinata]|uniref:D-apiose isomerase-like n=1 Tax=Saccostrea echinata TaxID=191078 RepID=UPI002A81BBEA|nr:D-apiose isomerase-like [Saccostrea echinata]
MFRHAVITAFLGRTRDRFQYYNEERSLEQKFALVQSIAALSGVEIVYPYEVETAERTRELLTQYQLEVAAVNVNVKAEPEFLQGGLSSSRRQTRERAVQLIREAKDFALAVGADKVTCCPLGDGYEFAFQTAYARVWDYFAESLGAAAEYRPELPLFIEPKPCESRGSCFFDTATRTALFIQKLGLPAPAMGVTIDFGHSIYARQNPSEEIALLQSLGIPFYVHINDNDKRWDWDYISATRHVWEYTEFLYHLMETGYRDFLTTDAQPTRWDMREFFADNCAVTDAIVQKLHALNEVQQLDLVPEKFLENRRLLAKEVFGLA